MSTRWLLDVPFRDWRYEDVDDFLQARIAENEQVEYKEQLPADLQDTLVAMSNGSGGYIFIGVKEVAGQNTPHTWPHLTPGSLKESTIFNKAGSETSPPVRPQVRVLTDPASNNQIMAVRVEPGDNPPYFAKNRGVFVRVGERNTQADPRTLEMLFAKRSGFADQYEAHHTAFLAHLERETPFVALYGFVSPLVSAVRLALEGSLTTKLHDVVDHYFPGIVENEERFDQAVHFGRTHRWQMSVLRDGTIRYFWALGNEGQPLQQVSLFDVWLHIDDLLACASRIYTSFANYDGPLFVGVGARNIANRPAEWPAPWVLGSSALRRQGTGSVDLWSLDDLPFRVGDDSMAYARQAIISLAWRMGYDNCRDYVLSWGSQSSLRRAWRGAPPL